MVAVLQYWYRKRHIDVIRRTKCDRQRKESQRNTHVSQTRRLMTTGRPQIYYVGSGAFPQLTSKRLSDVAHGENLCHAHKTDEYYGRKQQGYYKKTAQKRFELEMKAVFLIRVYRMLFGVPLIHNPKSLLGRQLYP